MDVVTRLATDKLQTQMRKKCRKLEMKFHLARQLPGAHISSEIRRSFVSVNDAHRATIFAFADARTLGGFATCSSRRTLARLSRMLRGSGGGLG